MPGTPLLLTLKVDEDLSDFHSEVQFSSRYKFNLNAEYDVVCFTYDNELSETSNTTLELTIRRNWWID